MTDQAPWFTRLMSDANEAMLPALMGGDDESAVEGALEAMLVSREAKALDFISAAHAALMIAEIKARDRIEGVPWLWYLNMAQQLMRRAAQASMVEQGAIEARHAPIN